MTEVESSRLVPERGGWRHWTHTVLEEGQPDAGRFIEATLIALNL